MEEQGGENKRVSIGDALEALRQKKAEKGAAAPSVSAAAGAQKNVFIPPSFWLDNLQDGVQRSRDKLYDSIAQNPSATNGLSRRDLAPTESFYVPSEMLQEVGAAQPNAAPTFSDVSRFQNVEVLDMSAMRGTVVDEGHRPGAGAAVSPGPGATAVPEIQLDGTVEVDLSGNTTTGEASAGTVSRFEVSSALTLQGQTFEEVQVAQEEAPSSKFRVNPMFRQILQSKGEG